MDSNYIFVYGTLRKHERNHSLLKSNKLAFSQAWVKGALYDTGLGYPALDIDTEGITYGELYEITGDVLRALDILEDYEEGREENLFLRKILPVYTDESTLRAYVYIIAPSNKDLLQKEIPFGDWKIHSLLEGSNDRFYYFAFGSCMDKERFHSQGVDYLFNDQLGTGILENFHLCYSRHADDGGRADLREGHGQVEGIVYFLHNEALNYLFEREGVYGSVYRPTFIDITINGKLLTDVLTFTVVDKKKDLAPPNHYALEILRGAKGMVSEKYYFQLKEQMKILGVDVEKLEILVGSK